MATKIGHPKQQIVLTALPPQRELKIGERHFSWPNFGTEMKATAIFTLVLLTGCNWPQSPVSNQPVGQARFQLISAEGQTYRLDSTTGAMNLITGDGMFALMEKTQVLHIGDYLEMADAKDNPKYLKYLGNGAFEKSLFSVVKKGPASP